MKIIKIFLASSSELKSDREQFEIFINRKNKYYIREKSLFLELVIWEDFLDAMSKTRSQDEYNKEITNCDVFVALIHTKVGKYTNEEFLKALETFTENGKPLIFTYFKNEAIDLDEIKKDDILSLLDFKEKLSKLGHFYTKCKDINEIKFHFDQQLDKFIPNDIQQQEEPILQEEGPIFDVNQRQNSVIKQVMPPPGVVLKDFGFEIVAVNEKGEVVKREKGRAQYFTEELGNGVILDMVAIPGGKFLMGTEDEEIERIFQKFNWEQFRKEKPQHEVTVQPFFMGKYPVTQGQWKAVASLPKVQRDLKVDPSNFKGGNRPVENVFWEEAVEFCLRVSKQTGKEYRLPSEAEWEYACRAGTTTPFYFGKTITTDLANYRGADWKLGDKVLPGNYANEPTGKYRKETSAVGIFPPNSFGLYDMHGNVWEWCEDDFHESYGGAPTDGRAWISGFSSKKVIRGVSWRRDIPYFCRSAYRDYFSFSPNNRLNDFGFRVVCVAPTT